MAVKELVLKIHGDATGAKNALGQVRDKTDELGSRLQGFGTAMTLGVTAPIVAGFASAVRAAAEEAQEMAVLQHALEQNTGATEAQVAAVEEWITATQNATGVADSLIRTGLTELVSKGNSVAESQAIMTAAMDISAATGNNLESVLDALAKAANGNVTALGRMGLEVKNTDGSLKSFDQIMAQVADRMGGSAAAAADTVAGRMAIASAKFNDAKEALGAALIPVLEQFASALAGIATWFTNLSPAMQGVIVKLLVLAAAIGPAVLLFSKLRNEGETVRQTFSRLGSAATSTGAILGGLATVVGVSLLVAWQQNKASVEGFKTAIEGLTGAASELALTQDLVRRGIDDTGIAATISAVAHGTATQAQIDFIASNGVLTAVAADAAEGVRLEAEAVRLNTLALIEGGKAFVDTTANAEGFAGAQKTLADNTAAATGALQTQIETMAAQISPALGYLQSLQNLREANANLALVQGDVEASADDVAAANLDVVSAYAAVQGAGTELRNNPDALAALRSAGEAAGIATGDIEMFASTLGGAFTRGDVSPLRARLTGLSEHLRDVTRDVDALGSAFGRLPATVNTNVNVSVTGAGAGSFLDGRF